ncbi:unnamed protein product [marine sediment metagenome]|uniref:Uncharacterized protein n=1 Tax=marine sediment metagenome TaxID=412755 RepID=X1QTF8_9ZZZZ
MTRRKNLPGVNDPLLGLSDLGSHKPFGYTFTDQPLEPGELRLSKYSRLYLYRIRFDAFSL